LCFSNAIKIFNYFVVQLNSNRADDVLCGERERERDGVRAVDHDRCNKQLVAVVSPSVACNKTASLAALDIELVAAFSRCRPIAQSTCTRLF
jgi:hypothetical protein